MLSKDILKFLRTLGQNNSREWFHANKEWYDNVRNDFELFVNIMIHEIGKLDSQVKGVQVKDCVFRIHRDTRFSTDKTPYKTNFGAYVVRGGKKSQFAGYYLHLEPKGCFLAGGLWMPPADILKTIRSEIYYHPEEFLRIVKSKDFKKQFETIEGEQLVNAPKGFPPDFEYIDFLKFKSYTVSKFVPDKSISEVGFLVEMRNVYSAMVPFNRFLNKAIEENH